MPFFLMVFNSYSNSFPWQPTFSGINVEPTDSFNTPSGPFQTPSGSATQTKEQNNNPFLAPTQNTTKVVAHNPSSIASILSNPTASLFQKSNAAFTTSTSIGGASLKITPHTKLRTTIVSNTLGNLMNISFTQLQKKLKKPEGALFPDHPFLERDYQNFMRSMEEAPDFLPLFKKIHITALHQIYIYLTGIYTALNMTHIDDIKSYMMTEKKYALNKKTLIINKLLSLVMNQLNQAIQALMPGIPENYALNAGMACIQSDKISDPQIFILDMEKSVLAVLGLEKLEPFQITACYVALQKYIPLLNIQSSPELTFAINALSTTSFSAKKLSHAQANALVAALRQIISYLTNQQTKKEYTTIIPFLTTSLSKTPSDKTILLTKKFISQLVYGQALTSEITFCKEFTELLTTKPSSYELTPSQIKNLKGIIGYILKRYETIATKQISQIIQTLGELNPSYEILSPSQSLELLSLSKAMLSKQNPLFLENLSDQQRSLLAYGLWISSTSKLFSQSSQKAFQEISTELKKHALVQSSLSEKESLALQEALTSFSNYRLDPLSTNDFKNAAQQQLTKFNPKLTTAEQESIITQALQTINSGKFTSFDQLTKEEQIILLQLFQLVDQVLETRLSQHTAMATELSFLLESDKAAQNALFANISASQYETLQAISDFLLKTQGPLSLQTLLQVAPSLKKTQTSSLTAPEEALIQLIAPTKTTGTKKIAETSYFSLLLALQKQHFQDNALLTIISQLSSNQKRAYKKTLMLFSEPKFNFSSIPEAVRLSLAKNITDYLSLKKSDAQSAPPVPSNLTNPNESALETVANVVQYTHQNTKMRSKFLWALNQYLVFFNNYAQLLEKTTSNKNNDYLGLTEFADAAQSIQKQLAYKAYSQEGIAQLIKQTNPPLFFYDALSFRAIRLLPKLADSVKYSSIAPYPTFGIEQAISPNGSAIDPLTGQQVTNTTTLGPHFSYQKFFFLEAAYPTKELTGILPSWIKTINIPDSKGKKTILYEPENIPEDGITGFYMNLPTFQQNPLNNNAALIYLYEQPIIAQPEWLNRPKSNPEQSLSGIIPKNKASIITMLRGCLGDFQALLDLTIFDPCLTIIFKKALATSQNADIPKNPSTSFTLEEEKRCATYISEKEKLLKQQENPVGNASHNSLSGASA